MKIAYDFLMMRVAAVLAAGILSLCFPLLAVAEPLSATNGGSVISGDDVVASEDRASAFDIASRDAALLAGGIDYQEGVLIVELDGRTTLAGTTTTAQEYARAAIATERGRSTDSSVQLFSTESFVGIRPSVIKPSALPDSDNAGGGLASMGDLRFVAAGEWLNGSVLAVANVPEGISVSEAVEALREDPTVLSVSLEYYYEPADIVGENETVSVSTDDPSNDTYDNSWHLGTAAVYGAWSYVKTQGSVTVVVMDSGVDVDHPDLRLNLDLDNALDAYNNTPLQGDTSATSHGTHVAGIISARAHNGQGCAGVSYNAKVLPISVMNPSTGKMPASAIVAAFDHVFDLINSGVGDNIRVVNMSFSGDSVAPAYAGKLADALAFYDLTLVAAAGNDNTTATRTPSDLDSCISVININADGFRYSTSNYGQAKDISAPGVSIYSTVDGGGFAKKTGTSMAAPVVSGVAALLYAADPNATAAEVRNALIDGAVDLGATGFDIYTANGMVNAADAVEVLLFGVNYRDVMTEEWYVRGGYLTYVVTNGLMSGYTSDPTSFGPEDDLTRAQFATVLYRMANPNSQATSNPDFYADNTTAFTDVQDGKWYTAAINWANRVGILTGDTATNYTTVRPNDPLTREEAAVMSYRFAGVVGASTSVSGMSTPNVIDWNDVASWAQTAMKWCYHKNVIGKWHNGDGTYSAMPEENTTRAMMTKVATVLHRDIMP